MENFVIYRVLHRVNDNCYKVLDLEKTGTQKRYICGEVCWKASCRTDLEDTLILGGRYDHDHVVS